MSSQQLVANELLAFIQHAIDTMDEVSILQICKSNFKEEEISSGKKLLYESLGKLDQMPSRRRDGTEKSLQDIITLLKVTDPDDVPAFVAKELHKLPPVGFDHVDVTSLLKDIRFLKTSLADMKTKFEASEKTTGELRAEVVALRNTISASRSPDACKCNVNTRRGAAVNDTVSSFESANLDASARADIAEDVLPPSAARTSPPVEVPTRVATSTPQRGYAAVATNGSKTSARNNKVAVTTTKQQGGENVSRRELTQRGPAMDQCDEEGFIKVERKKKKKPTQNQRGTAATSPNHLLRPAVPTTLLYVSRLHDTTKCEEVEHYIGVKTNFSVRVERLDSRHGVNFNSFVVRVPTEHLSVFMKEEFWPRGVVYRRYRGRLPDTTRHTTPTQRVK